MENYAALIRKHAGQGLLIDTNVLMLLLVGNVDPTQIPTVKVTANRGFTERDFDLLVSIVVRFSRIITTPHILAEVSNHADKLKRDSQNKLEAFVSRIESCDERFDPAAQIAKSVAFEKFGLTDGAISELAMKGVLVLTVDFPLYGYLQKKGADVVNFNHLRPLAWDA